MNYDGTGIPAFMMIGSIEREQATKRIDEWCSDMQTLYISDRTFTLPNYTTLDWEN